MRAVCRLDDLPLPGSRGFEVDSQSIFLVNCDDGVFAYRNRCPHLGVELEWVEHQFLDADGAYIQCATHGALFTLADGECVFGPCQGQHLQALRCCVSAGTVLVDVPPDTSG